MANITGNNANVTVNMTNIADINASRAKTIVNTTSELWGKRIAIIPIDLLDIDYSYQRVCTSHVNTLYDEWDRDECDPLIVSYRNGKFYIIDGQHRYYAALGKKLEDLPCIVRTGLSQGDEARIFVKTNTSRKQLKPIDTFKANITCGNETIPEVKRDMVVKKVCEKYNIEIWPDNFPSKARKLRSLTTVRRIVEMESAGEKCLDWIFQTIKETEWYDCGEAYRDSILSAIKTFYVDNANDLDKAKGKLIKIMTKYSPMDLIAYAKKKYSDYGRYASLAIALRELA